jgi:hypothetical protein
MGGITSRYKRGSPFSLPLRGCLEEHWKKTLLVSVLVSLLISAVLTTVLWLIPGVGGCAVVGILPGVASFWGLKGL